MYDEYYILIVSSLPMVAIALHSMPRAQSIYATQRHMRAHSPGVELENPYGPLPGIPQRPKSRSAMTHFGPAVSIIIYQCIVDVIAIIYAKATCLLTHVKCVFFELP